MTGNPHIAMAGGGPHTDTSMTHWDRVGQLTTWGRYVTAVEKDVTEYVVSYGPASDPMWKTVRVNEPRVRLADAPAGTQVAVKAINGRGLEGWDYARATVR